MASLVLTKRDGTKITRTVICYEDEFTGDVDILVDNDLVLSLNTDGTMTKYIPTLETQSGFQLNNRGKIKTSRDQD